MINYRQLADRRERLGLTISEVATGMFVSVRTIYNIEHGIGPKSTLLYYKLYLDSVSSK